MRILIDMDSTVVDFMGGLWPAYEKATGFKGSTEQILGWNMAPYVEDPAALLQCFHEPGFFAGLMPLPGAINALTVLDDIGHELVIVSTPSTPQSAAEKYEWCAKYLGFISPKNVIMCARKELIHGDVLIDDSPETARAIRYLGNTSMVVTTIAYPYNDTTHFNYRADGYQDPLKAWRDLVSFIEDDAGFI